MRSHVHNGRVREGDDGFILVELIHGRLLPHLEIACEASRLIAWSAMGTQLLAVGAGGFIGYFCARNSAIAGGPNDDRARP